MDGETTRGANQLELSATLVSCEHNDESKWQSLTCASRAYTTLAMRLYQQLYDIYITSTFL